MTKNMYWIAMTVLLGAGIVLAGIGIVSGPGAIAGASNAFEQDAVSKKKRCKYGYQWSTSRKRCVRNPQGSH